MKAIFSGATCIWVIAYALHLGRLPPCHPSSSRSLYLDSGWSGSAGWGQRKGVGDRQDERMGGCNAKYTHLSTPRARSLLCDSPSLGQENLRSFMKGRGWLQEHLQTSALHRNYLISFFLYEYGLYLRLITVSATIDLGSAISISHWPFIRLIMKRRSAFSLFG